MSTIQTRTRRLSSSGTRELNDTSNRDQENVCSSLKRKSSSIKSILEEARRATIQNPSRPFTPRDDNRKLFVENEYTNRPQSAYSIDSIHFDAKLVPLYNKVCFFIHKLDCGISLFAHRLTPSLAKHSAHVCSFQSFIGHD